MSKLFDKDERLSWQELQPYAFEVASNLLGCEVTSEETDITCPGEELHSNETHEGHTKLYIDDGIPTIHCVHESCADVNADYNRELRRRIRYMELALLAYQKNQTERYTRLSAAAVSGSYTPANAEVKARAIKKEKAKEVAINLKEPVDLIEGVEILSLIHI